VHIFERDFFKATWYLCLPEIHNQAESGKVADVKWQTAPVVDEISLTYECHLCNVLGQKSYFLSI